ncbi:MAG: hypothetical protein O2875_01430 [Planctomycetota bacterium]|nr:hypothetical protein [Planctomycetota bacterium]MDA1262535.1 hypothetical protein [Planctomycetota bacterium]
MNPQEFTENEWAFTPDVILFIAAAILSVGLTVFALILFRRAAREERRQFEASAKRNVEKKS